MKDFKFDKGMTGIAKGMAIILMINHHLFAFPERLPTGGYHSIFTIGNEPIEQLFGLFGKICVAMFLFLSGYGLYKTYHAKTTFTFKDSIKRSVQFLKYYYVIFAIFVPVGIFFFKENPRFIYETQDFIFNLLTLKSTYNGEWWFAPLYLELLILFPVLIKFVEKSPILLSYLSFIAMILSSFFSRMIPHFPNNQYINIALTHISAILFWQLVFIVGIFFAKYLVFEKIDFTLSKAKLNHVIVHIIILLGCYFIRQEIVPFIIKTVAIMTYNLYDYADFIVAPFIIYSSVKIVSKIKILSIVFVFLGNHSNNIWLTHTFFAYHFFQKGVFYPHYSFFIAIWLFALTILSSFIINGIVKVISFKAKQKVAPS